MMGRSWWRVDGPGPAHPAGRIFRDGTQVRGARARTVRRLVRIGPFSFWVIRYGAPSYGQPDDY